MKRDLRLLLYEKVLGRMLFELRDHDYVIFEDSRDDSRYVQYLVHDSAVCGGVRSRHLLPESGGLAEEAVNALGCLRFQGGGSRRHLSRDPPPHRARRLAFL